MGRTYKENLTQEEIDELVVNLPPDEEMPEVNHSDYELLTQDDIDSLMALRDYVPFEAESELRDSLIDLRDTLEKCGSLLYKIEKLSDAEHCDFATDDVEDEEEPYWAEKLSKEQKKKFDEILVELKNLPEEILAAGEKVLALAVSGGLSKVQIDECNKMYVRIASSTIEHSFFALNEKIQSLPIEQLEQLCAVRFTVRLAARQSFKKMFSLGTKSPLLSKENLHAEIMQDYQSRMEDMLSDPDFSKEYDAEDIPSLVMKSEDEKRWRQFFEGKSSSPYFSYYADTVLSLNIASLNLQDKVWQYLNYLGIGTLEELCALPPEKVPALQEEMSKVGLENAVGEISDKLAGLGLCFGTSREDLIAVCDFPLVIKHYGGAGFYELEHPFDRLGTREVIRKGDGKTAERKTDFAMIGDIIDMFLDLGGTLMHVPGDTKTLQIPPLYTTIPSVAFVGCNKLEELTIGKDVYEIGSFAFELPALKEFRYEGTVAEWNSIKKDKLWNFGINVPFVDCSDGKADIALCIKDNVLLSCSKNAVNVEIPEEVCRIAELAFSDCEKLESVKIPESVRKIGEYAFKNCKSLKEINLLENLTEIAEYAFEHCVSLESFRCPKNLKEIKGYAFCNCQNLETLELNEGLARIGYCSFQGCLNLAKVSIPASVKSIKKNAFDNCIMYAGFTVAEENKNFAAEDGILYSKDKKTLVRCPCYWGKGKTEVVIPQSVESVCESAFSGCTYIERVDFPPNVKVLPEDLFEDCGRLKSVLLPENVEKMCSFSFLRCKSLESITIPSSLKKIEHNTFWMCEKLKEIRFDGTVEEWRKVIRIHDFAKECPVSEVICTDGKAELGNDKEDWEII